MQKIPGRCICFSTIVWLLTVVGVTIVVSSEASQSDPPVVVRIAADGIQRATVSLDSYSYNPNHLIVEANRPVELTLTSVTTFIPHNFIIRGAPGSLFIEQDVSAGKTITITFTPTQLGTFPIYCDKRLWPMPSHRDKGMEGTLEVR
jgi:heme/copper-type cytochrome/quinol oxidase subunit 2